MVEVEKRIMRIALPVPLIREMDSVILKGVGGYETRAEFIVDAIQERILELSSDGVEDAGAPPGAVGSLDATGTALAAVVQTEPSSKGAVTMSSTALAPLTAGFTLQLDSDLSRPEGRPLFGLHNRDYPSLWALTKLASLTQDEPILVESYFDEVLKEAWQFGERLLDIEGNTGTKCTAIFPTNPGKRKPAEMGFRSFAIGDYRRGADDTFTTSGPLFEWRLAGLAQGRGEEPMIAVTPEGWALLEAIADVSVEEPHPTTASTRFFDHLRQHTPADWKGFVEIIRAIGRDGATRQDVLDHMAKTWTEWTENEVSTNAAGYIARAREWGLVEPKQTKGHYHLTALGHQHETGEKR